MTGKQRYLYKTILLLDIFALLLSFIFSVVVVSDEYEHLRMSFLISEGFIPYRDFFEHHHPLMWYVFAPIIKVLPQNFMVVFYVSRTLALLASLLLMYFVYTIFRDFFNDKELMPYFGLVVLIFYPLWYGLFFFKPDVFSHLGFFAGIYYFFKYLQDKRVKDLSIAGICFTVGFLFLQTLILNIIPLGFVILYYIHKKQCRIQDCFWAALPSLVILFIFVMLLWINNALEPYWQLNWIYNYKAINSNTALSGQTTFIWPFIPLLSVGVIAWIWEYKQGLCNKFYNIIFFMYIYLIIRNIWFLACFPHYLITTFILCAILIAPAFKKIASTETHHVYNNTIACCLIFSWTLNTTALYLANNTEVNTWMREINKTSSLTTITVTSPLYQIYSPHHSYYEMFAAASFYDDYLFHRYPNYNLSTLISNLKPQYLSYSENMVYSNSRFMVSDEVLENYEKVNTYLWRRKKH